jgi:D-2-hydroxyacid dehydrogenase (NADP+)
MITIESTFSKMKKSSVFINIGRGSTVKEDDLITALKQKMIAGAVLDVFEKEPLSEKSELWDFDNVYISPHFACCDKDVYKRTISNFGDNLEAYAKGGKENLLTIVDKNKGY